MGKKTVPCTDLPTDLQSLVQGKMGDVRSPADAADYEDVHSAEALYGLFGDVVGIGQIAQAAETESKDGQLVVHGPHGDYLHSSDAEGLLSDGVQDEVRNSGVAVVAEGVGVLPSEGILDYRLGVDGKCPVHEVVEGPHVIQSAGMVLVHVGEQHGIQLPDTAAQNLLPEVRAGVHHQSQTLVFDVCGGSQPLVVEVVRPADGTGAADDGHALGSACPQKFYFIADFSAHRPQR